MNYMVLFLVKPMYGFGDAPLLWQLGFSVFLKQNLGAHRSLLDDNFYYWPGKQEQDALASVHVDNVLVCASPPWLTDTLHVLEKRYGKVKRQQLPFDHIGLSYQPMPEGLYIGQAG